jgi:hypothetical protein
MSEFRELQPRHAFLVTANDADQAIPLQGLRVTNETAAWANLKVRNANGNPNSTSPLMDVVFRIGPGATDYVPGQFSRVWQTGTDIASLTIHGYCDHFVK